VHSSTHITSNTIHHNSDTPPMISNNISGADQECASFLMSLKHRTITPPLSKSEQEFPRRVYSTTENDTTNNRDMRVQPFASPVPPPVRVSSVSPSAISPMQMCMPIATEEDSHFLTEAQCFIRSHCCEFFVSDSEGIMNLRNDDIFPSALSTTCGSGGGRGPVSAGRVGIRCSFCKHASPSMKASQSMSFPSNLGGIYGAVVMLQCRHLTQCSMMPIDAKKRLHDLKYQRVVNNGHNHPIGIQQYWIESARKLGLYDTPDGIRLETGTLSRLQFQYNSPQSHSNLSNSCSHSLQMTPSSLMNGSMNNSNMNMNMNMNGVVRQVSDSCVNLISRDAAFKIAANDAPSPPPILAKKTSRVAKVGGKNKRNVAYDCFDSVEEYHRSRASQSPSGKTSPTQPKKALPPKATPSPPKTTATASTTTTSEVKNDISDEKLLELMGNTQLVETQDKDLVPDYLYLAMAQMNPCHLTDADRVGCYKEREIGFLGMCCKHCGGQPGFGKYFPATVRSLAQTTTSQTIVKHIATKCRLCPPEIRKAVVALQEEQANKDRAVKDANGSAFESRPRYGSRKIFFQRLWSRLHGGDLPVPHPVSVRKEARPTRAVVSPHFDESLTCPTKFSNRWPSIARHMMKSDENNMQQHNMNESNDFQCINENDKRSRSVSYIDDDDDYQQNSHPRRRMVSD
jgi:hypothetical protein